ncbi:MAG: histidine phosphatase family protein [Ilumatobacter sp.]|uniref:histidine phosphatase family protein n=1 Tax=Ilumatobacter sp. TaxID=1967498 RepID=UPI002613B56E|nr:histidine phosphatase family protein [Ilumatobacter sp.]MDJ0769920.1 histidine phosphatase family protein [Ilumatobacter sp.]
MELILIRHALPERREQTDGPADPPLAEAGHRQARRLADYLSTERIDAIYTSPLRRAVETASPLTEATGCTATVVDGVAEWDRQSTEYVPIEELKAAGDPRYHEVINNLWEGEDPVEDFEQRVTTSLDAIIADHAGDTVAVVCHGGVINLFLATVLGIGEERTGFFYPNYTSINRVAASRSGVRSVVTINETAHLRNTGLPMGIFQNG